MTEKVIVALIALTGVLISGLLSFYISSNQVKTTVKNLKIELKSKYNEKLYAKRLDNYPKLYKSISDLGKDLRKVELIFSVLKNRLEEIEKWDSENAILLSPSSTALILDLRNILDSYTNFDPKYNGEKQVGRIARENIFESALNLEQAIKKEIGVYDIEGYHNPSLPKSYPHSWKYLPDE